MRKTVWAGVVAAMFAGEALAVSVDARLSAPYIGASGGYEINDTDRDADNGYGFALHFGFPLAWRYGAVEVNYWDATRDRSLDDDEDYQASLMVNYVQDFGSLSVFKPFISIGVGGVQEDVLGEKETRPAADGGIGTLIALPFFNSALRAEAKALTQWNDRKSAPGNEEFITDYRVMLGLQIPLLMGAAAADPVEPPPATEACDLQLVDPATGRTNCASDSDKDGVADGTDQCPGTPPGTLVSEVGCPAVAMPAPMASDVDVRRVEAQYVTFGTNKADLDDESKRKLDDVASLMAADPGLRVEIEGRADSRGSEAYNIVLGAQRAESVRQYLISRGADPVRLTTISLGEFNPVASNRNDGGRKENRSVRFRLIGGAPASRDPNMPRPMPMSSGSSSVIAPTSDSMMAPSTATGSGTYTSGGATATYPEGMTTTMQPTMRPSTLAPEADGTMASDPAMAKDAEMMEPEAMVPAAVMDPAAAEPATMTAEPMQ